MRCSNGEEYNLIVPYELNARATVADCKVLKQMFGQDCWGPM